MDFNDSVAIRKPTFGSKNVMAMNLDQIYSKYDEKEWINVHWPSDLPISALCGSCHCFQVLRKQVNPGQLSEFP